MNELYEECVRNPRLGLTSSSTPKTEYAACCAFTRSSESYKKHTSYKLC